MNRLHFTLVLLYFYRNFWRKKKKVSAYSLTQQNLNTTASIWPAKPTIKRSTTIMLRTLYLSLCTVSRDGISGYLCLVIWILRYPNTWISRPSIQILKKWGVQISDILNIQIVKYPNIKNWRDISNYPRIRILDSWNSFNIKRSNTIMLRTPYLSSCTTLWALYTYQRFVSSIGNIEKALQVFNCLGRSENGLIWADLIFLINFQQYTHIRKSWGHPF